MSLLNYNLENVEELPVLPEGQAELRCTNAEIKHSDATGGDFVQLSLQPVGDEVAKPITTVIMLPAPGDDDAKKQQRLWNLKQACLAFGVDMSGGVDTEDFKGRQAEAIITVRETDAYGKQNDVRRFIEPR